MAENTRVAEWIEISEALRAEIPEASFSTWFSNIEAISVSESEIVLGAANRFVKSWLEQNYAGNICNSAEAVLGARPAVKIVISKRKFKESIQKEDTALLKTLQPVIEKDQDAVSEPIFVNSKHSLDSFIALESNEFALAVLKKLVDNPSEYSPFYLYSGHGLGKTHLLHALCREYGQKYPEKNIICISAANFVQTCSNCYIDRSIEQFRKRFASCDLLVVDDIHILGQGKKVASQKELAAILEQLELTGAQVVLSADRAANEIAGLESLLSSRLCSGLQARLETLSEKDRVKLLLAKSEKMSVEDAEKLAAKLAGDVREIDGVVKTYNARLEFGAKGEDVLAGIAFSKRKRTFTPEEIIAAVSLEFDIKQEEIKGKKRTGAIVLARRVAIHLTRKLSDASLAEIGQSFGGRSHPTILTALKTSPCEATRLNVSRLEKLFKALGSNLRVEEFLHEQQQIF